MKLVLKNLSEIKLEDRNKYLNTLGRRSSSVFGIESFRPLPTIDAMYFRPKYKKGQFVSYNNRRHEILDVIVDGFKFRYTLNNCGTIAERDIKPLSSMVKEYTDVHRDQINEMIESIKDVNIVCQNTTIQCARCVFGGDNATCIGITGCGQSGNIKGDNWITISTNYGVEKFLKDLIRDLGPTKEDVEKVSKILEDTKKKFEIPGIVVIPANWDNEDDKDPALDHNFKEHIKEEEKVRTTNKFEVGDRVWSSRLGWGVVIHVIDKGSYPIQTRFNDIELGFTEDGKEYISDNIRTLFFDELPIPNSATVKKAWRADEGGAYYYISTGGEVKRDEELLTDTDNRRYNIGNYFRTTELAKESNIYKAFNGGDL